MLYQVIDEQLLLSFILLFDLTRYATKRYSVSFPKTEALQHPESNLQIDESNIDSLTLTVLATTIDALRHFETG